MNAENIYSLSLQQKKNLVKIKNDEYNAKVNELSANNNEYKQAIQNLSKIGSELTFATLSGDKEKLSRLKIESVKYSAIKNEIENRAGIKHPEPDCLMCNDTGYVNGKLCSCVKKIASAMLVDSALKSAPIDSCRFETFNLDYYDDSLPDGTSPKKRMTIIFKSLKEYALSFSPEKSESMIFFGKTGIGKTHLSLSIMNELLNKGFFVLYDSAFNLFSKIETEHFKEHIDDTYNSAIGCDLLIIDDLGSEYLSSYSQSVFYSIVNTRILERKPTIINTNLSMQEIENRYTPRVSSRIVGEYTAKKFIGNDIRQKKKLMSD